VVVADLFGVHQEMLVSRKPTVLHHMETDLRHKVVVASRVTTISLLLVKTLVVIEAAEAELVAALSVVRKGNICQLRYLQA
jgi:hypothetical protein